ncbi:Hypothetical protein PHPALM_18346 [Phytophthora palmivora]|uniref:Ankyrin repeat-containing domain n=1 Tax=Phytophthora palmivora TaxID=4796 RepID=A0A2P4XJY8_9STRA|nr:Hypothetical protein PHPALM_18346 [Phytophthora palmivora]
MISRGLYGMDDIHFILTNVQLSCRQLEGLPHVVHLIQQFTENISQRALVTVVKKKKTHFFFRTLRAVDESLNMVHEEKLRQYRLAMQLIPHNMTLKQGELKALKEIYQRYPGAVDEEVVYAIASAVELPVLKWLYKCKPLLFKQFKFCDSRVFMYASATGADNVVHWIVKLFPDTVRSLVYGTQGGHLKLLKWIIEHTKWDKTSIGDAWLEAIKRGHLDIAKFLYEIKPPTISLRNVNIESLEMLQWIHDLNRWKFNCKRVNDAARDGRLVMLQWLHVHYRELFSTDTMNVAAENGQLKVLKFLHDNRNDGCTTAAMDLAAKNGFLDVVLCNETMYLGFKELGSEEWTVEGGAMAA